MDASDGGIEGVFLQIQHGHNIALDCLVRNQSHSLTMRELLAVVQSVEYFYNEMYERICLLRTNQAPLSLLLWFKSPEDQVARWLQEYNFTAEHTSSVCHRNTDAMWRRPCIENYKHCYSVEGKLNKEILKDQKEDHYLMWVLWWKRTGRRPSWNVVYHYPPILKTVTSIWFSHYGLCNFETFCIIG